MANNLRKFGGYRLMVRHCTVDAIMSVRFWLATLSIIETSQVQSLD